MRFIATYNFRKATRSFIFVYVVYIATIKIGQGSGRYFAARLNT